ncbi:MAG: hypothetical protein JXC32_09525 [Anaerolineae bacterium]|nr:hypothetical protein [Anaerolineae bacterium]
MAKTEREQLMSQRVSWLIWAGLAVLVILLGSAFSQAWRTNQALKGELATLQPMVTAALREQSTLEAHLAYVQSDAYVEAWSKTRAKMALPGETLVVSVYATPTPVVEPVPESPAPLPAEEPAPLGWLKRLLGQ